MELNNLKDTVEFALGKEREAVAFYRECSERAEREAMKRAFLEMAEEEEGHVRMLTNFNPENVESVKLKNIPNLKISDFLVEMEFEPGMGYRDLLILAMKREESAHGLYSSLAQENGDASMQKLFRFLAQEELKHKNRLEREYDERVLQQN